MTGGDDRSAAGATPSGGREEGDGARLPISRGGAEAPIPRGGAAAPTSRDKAAKDAAPPYLSDADIVSHPPVEDAASPSGRAAEGARPRGGTLLVLLAAGVAFLILIGLGTWQLERLAWKEELLARVAARIHAEPSPFPPPAAWPTLTREADEYRRVRVRGTYDHAREVLVYTVRGDDAPGQLKGQGFLVVTPLLRADGPPVLVNRGFVPAERRDLATRREAQVAGEVEVTGLLRFAEDASWFVPANDAARRAFYRMDPVGIAAAAGVAGAAPFVLDAEAGTAPGGLPAGGATRVAFPNRHLEYALTWYGLAAALVGVTAAFLWSRRRRG